MGCGRQRRRRGRFFCWIGGGRGDDGHCRVAFPISPINSQQKKTLNLEKEAFSANIFIDKYTEKNIVLFHFLTGAWIMENFVLNIRCRKAMSK